jgi:phosphohistidine phosphatase SixA
MLVYRSVPSRPTESRRRFNAGALGLCAGPFLPSYAEASSDTSHIVGHLKLNLLDELLMMRHADAPGYSDPQTMRLDDCTSQRNLGDRGKQQAAASGHWLRQQGLGAVRVWSSPWCRCKDTAKLLGFGEPTLKHFLGSFFREPDRSTDQTIALTAALKAWFDEGPTQVLLVVTHQVNISAYAGRSAAAGEIFRVSVSKSGQARHAEPLRT